jgi:parallel beta-helix repeat protein
LAGVSNVSILNSTLTSGDLPWYELSAIIVDNSSLVTIAGNDIKGGDCGILITRSYDNLIVRNNITGMSTGWNHISAGIMLYSSSNNTIYHNNFVNDALAVYIGAESSIRNNWDNGYPSGGNYWGDYESKYPNASEVDNSGIWNTPYVIDGRNIDYHPLIKQAPLSAPTPSESPTSTSTPTLTASLSESASALNFGNRVNFTVSVEGGNAPFTYAWYIDGKLVENSTSPYYATDSQPVGSHHVYVEVKDADNNTAKTLSPEFNVLPSLTYMPSSSASPTQQATAEPSQTPDRPKVGDFAPVLIPASIILLGIIAVGLLVHFSKHRGKKQ